MDRSTTSSECDDGFACDQRALPGFDCESGRDTALRPIALDSVRATAMALVDSGLRHIVLLAVRRDAGALAQIEVLSGSLARIANLLTQIDSPATRTALEQELAAGSRVLGIGIRPRHSSPSARDD
jgi:hypothetical protein